MVIQSNVNLATAQAVIRDVENYIVSKGGPYSAWYAGIATDAERRSFGEHNVSRTGLAIWGHCGNDVTARYVEDYFLRKGCKGGSGGGDSTTRYFYAYKITSYTSQ